MPTVTPADQILLHISTCKKAQLAAISAGGGRYPFPLALVIQQVTSDRLSFAGEHLRAGDQLIFNLQFRSAISRYYYSMYHAARSIVFAEVQGDDYERHNELPRHLPAGLHNGTLREQELVDARLLRNEADYNVYPSDQSEWKDDAGKLSVTAANFVQACEEFALTNGHV